MTDKPRIALIGYGRMGHEIESAIAEREWAEPIIIDPGLPAAFSSIADAPLDTVDVCIEFTEPSSALANVLALLDRGKPVISGTTGWDAQMQEVRDRVRDTHGAFMHASNFSIGVFIFTALVRNTAALLAKFPQYDLALHELHHRGKKDVPSGTANTLAKAVTDQHPQKRAAAMLPLEGPYDPETLYISSSRIGAVFGEHRLLADSDADSIELVHRAKGRRGFVEGALTAARWITGKQGFFTLEDMIDDLTTA